MIDLLLITAASATLPIGELKTFSDWVVGCDNGRACQAVALMSEDDIEGTTMVVTRGGEALARPNITININNGDATAIAIDGKRLPIRLTAASGFVEVDRNQTATLIAAMKAGRMMTVLDAKGKVIGTPSLSGVSAALLYIDERQQRLGTITALVRTGAKPALAVPATPTLPVIAAPKVPKLMPLRLTAADIARTLKPLECEANAEQTVETTYARLDANTTLALLPAPCGNGAYNYFSYALLIGNDGKTRPARFEVSGGMGEGNDNSLVNADWDEKKRELTTYAKGRGLGDCGTIQAFAWDGRIFRLKLMEVMDECRGSVDYIPVFRAAVR